MLTGKVNLIVRGAVKRSMAGVNERIGEGLIRIGAIEKDQVEIILKHQEEGDNRLFGEIAVELGFVNIEAIIDYLESKGEDE